MQTVHYITEDSRTISIIIQQLQIAFKLASDWNRWSASAYVKQRRSHEQIKMLHALSRDPKIRWSSSTALCSSCCSVCLKAHLFWNKELWYPPAPPPRASTSELSTCSQMAHVYCLLTGQFYMIALHVQSQFFFNHFDLLRYAMLLNLFKCFVLLSSPFAPLFSHHKLKRNNELFD